MADTQDIDSTCSTPYVSAPSSPGRNPSGYFFSAPASPMHYVLSKTKSQDPKEPFASSGSFEFEFSSRFSPTNPNSTGSMSSADELFFNGQIRPMRLSSHLQRPQILSPLLDLDAEENDEENDEVSVTRGRDFNLRNRSVRRKARSMSPLRNIDFEIEIDIPHHETKNENEIENENDNNQTPSSSRSSSSGRNNSKKWIFLKDLLYRSKSEGRGNSKEKFWSSISFSPSKEKKSPSPSPSLTPSSSRDEREKSQSKKTIKKSVSGKPANGVSKRRQGLSAHELHYTTNRAQAEEMKKKTFLPYRQGLLGCLGFNSKSYGALNGLARSLNPVSSR